MAREWQIVRQTRQPTYIVEGGLPSSGGHLVRVRASPNATVRPSGRSEMLRADLLKPDLLSEIVLLGSGALLFVSLLLIVVAAVTRA